MSLPQPPRDRRPYVPWFHGDFLRSTAGWVLMERAIYWMLLCAQWENGILPDDQTRLAAIAGVDMQTMTAAWNTVVGARFVKSRKGLMNKRMDEHRRNYLEFKRKQSEGGKKGMANRYGKSKAGNANVIDFPPGRETPRG